MPCSDGGPSREQIEQDARFHQTMTRLSCDRCRELEARDGKVPKWAAEWWENHQAHDAQRLTEQAEARRQYQVRKKALSKLTPEERDELGL